LIALTACFSASRGLESARSASITGGRPRVQ
jgi:hypothetical protein